MKIWRSKKKQGKKLNLYHLDPLCVSSWVLDLIICSPSPKNDNRFCHSARFYVRSVEIKSPPSPIHLTVKFMNGQIDREISSLGRKKLFWGPSSLPFTCPSFFPLSIFFYLYLLTWEDIGLFHILTCRPLFSCLDERVNSTGTSSDPWMSLSCVNNFIIENNGWNWTTK